MTTDYADYTDYFTEAKYRAELLRDIKAMNLNTPPAITCEFYLLRRRLSDLHEQLCDPDSTAELAQALAECISEVRTISDAVEDGFSARGDTLHQ